MASDSKSSGDAHTACLRNGAAPRIGSDAADGRARSGTVVFADLFALVDAFALAVDDVCAVALGVAFVAAGENCFAIACFSFDDNAGVAAISAAPTASCPSSTSCMVSMACACGKSAKSAEAIEAVVASPSLGRFRRDSLVMVADPELACRRMAMADSSAELLTTVAEEERLWGLSGSGVAASTSGLSEIMEIYMWLPVMVEASTSRPIGAGCWGSAFLMAKGFSNIDAGPLELKITASCKLPVLDAGEVNTCCFLNTDPRAILGLLAWLAPDSGGFFDSGRAIILRGAFASSDALAAAVNMLPSFGLPIAASIFSSSSSNDVSSS
mmetsp:Transcript_110831/g.236747  ORF Transcript_110831/g.236747 Transcript_110831/m.236747 type:complete len:326 (-) Transcript_110831:246-1223(-)